VHGVHGEQGVLLTPCVFCQECNSHT